MNGNLDESLWVLLYQVGAQGASWGARLMKVGLPEMRPGCPASVFQKRGVHSEVIPFWYLTSASVNGQE